MATTRRRFVPHAILAALTGGALAASGATAYAAPLPDSGQEYNSAGFVLRHAWMKYAYDATSPFRDDLTRSEEDARLVRYFELNALLLGRERTAGDASLAGDARAAARASLAALREERDSIENSAERIVEARLTGAIEQAGLTRRVGRDIVWPPVDIEFEDPPAVLVTSPRSEIRRESETLLQGDLPIERIERIEREAEGDGKTSALAVDIGGIAMYPAIIPPATEYHRALEDAAHEWLHHYLFFTPLGRRYYDSTELRTLNETLANLAGAELGALAAAAYPLPEPGVAAAPAPPPPARAPAFDFVEAMRGLRREVEALLGEGEIAQAESLMEETRVFLAENGRYIRRLNQAYFAFYGSYADGAGSIDPIGPKLQRLRDASGSVGAFVERARAITSEGELDAALRQ